MYCSVSVELFRYILIIVVLYLYLYLVSLTGTVNTQYISISVLEYRYRYVLSTVRLNLAIEMTRAFSVLVSSIPILAVRIKLGVSAIPEYTMFNVQYKYSTSTEYRTSAVTVSLTVPVR